MVGVDLEDLLEIRERVVVTVGVEHLGFLDLVHEAAVTVGISDNHAGLSCKTVGNYNIVDLLEKNLLGVFYEWLVSLG
jgi:hypothetical protein